MMKTMGVIFVTLLLCLSSVVMEVTQQEYIVYMGAKTIGSERVVLAKQHNVLLESVCGNDGHSRLKHVYHRSFNGFVATLTKEEAAAIAEREDVVSVFPNQKFELLTTRSWDFIGLTSQAKRSTRESDIIVGLLDSGIWPESESFSDHELGPPPSKWKGVCQSSANFSCNNKIIGARWYSLSKEKSDNEQEMTTPRDALGHGTHTASIAAGVETKKTASFFGVASGTARGGVPRARIAMYKVCWSYTCDSIDILAAFDDAVADGVDIMSVSMGMQSFAVDYLNDAIAIGSFHAMQHGVLTVAAVGNFGLGGAVNVAPWMLSVAASTIDRKFQTKVILGNGRRSYHGTSINTFDTGHSYPLIWKRACDDEDKVMRGKIILCEIARGTSRAVLSYGVKGYMTMFGCDEDDAEVTPYSQVCMSKDTGSRIYSYINSSSDPTARILNSTAVFDHGEPKVAKFSSRGPNVISPNILKPDITAPGVDILAAWPGDQAPTQAKFDSRVTKFNILSGTSMSCPHVSGLAAYVKEFYPTLSAAAIKSAIMTTATPMSRQLNKEGEFAYGSGQINPQKAINPGLIYDISESSYATFLCANGYTTKELRAITNDHTTCPKNATISDFDLNYPSLTLAGESESFSGTFHRILTNVGTPVSTYKVKVISSPSLSITVEPKVLSFNYLGQKLSFTAKVRGTLDADKSMLSGSIIWEDGLHEVRSPVVVYNKLTVALRN